MGVIDIDVSRFCVKVGNDFAVDDRDFDVHKGNRCKGAIARELNGGWIIADVIYENLDPLTGMYHDTIRNATTYEVCQGACVHASC